MHKTEGHLAVPTPSGHSGTSAELANISPPPALRGNGEPGRSDPLRTLATASTGPGRIDTARVTQDFGPCQLLRLINAGHAPPLPSGRSASPELTNRHMPKRAVNFLAVRTQDRAGPQGCDEGAASPFAVAISFRKFVTPITLGSMEPHTFFKEWHAGLLVTMRYVTWCGPCIPLP